MLQKNLSYILTSYTSIHLPSIYILNAAAFSSKTKKCEEHGQSQRGKKFSLIHDVRNCCDMYRCFLAFYLILSASCLPVVRYTIVNIFEYTFDYHAPLYQKLLIAINGLPKISDFKPLRNNSPKSQ